MRYERSLMPQSRFTIQLQYELRTDLWNSGGIHVYAHAALQEKQDFGYWFHNSSVYLTALFLWFNLYLNMQTFFCTKLLFLSLLSREQVLKPWTQSEQVSSTVRHSVTKEQKSSVGWNVHHMQYYMMIYVALFLNHCQLNICQKTLQDHNWYQSS